MPLASGKMDKEKCCYDNSAFVLTEKNIWMQNEVRDYIVFCKTEARLFLHVICELLTLLLFHIHIIPTDIYKQQY